MSSCTELRDGGQATVEAAFLLPVAMTLLLLLCQPVVLLYDLMVMQSAAGQGVRMIATRSADAPDEGYVRAIESQLSAVPNVSVFHVGDGWDVELEGCETSAEVGVTISTQVEPLPLIAFVVGALGLLDEDGYFFLKVEATSPTQPAWVLEQGGSPADWVSQWD